MDAEAAAVPVVGADAESVARRGREAGLEAAAVAADAATGVDDGVAIVAVGEAALVAVARRRPRTPVVPVAAGEGVRSVPRERLAGALEALTDGEFETTSRALLSVRTDGEETTALFDATLAAAPVQISEYAVLGTVDGTEYAAGRVRADGVVVATPAGSAGYTQTAGGPVAAPGTDCVVVVPLGPYAVDRERWVLRLPVRVAVEREEGAVRLFADGEAVGPVEPDESVTVTGGGTLPLAVVEEATPPFSDS